MINITIEYPNQERFRLWYQIPYKYAPGLTYNCDPFVIATILLAMNQSTDLIVHGTVSPSLLINLTEFQAAWACWRSSLYKPIEIKAESEEEINSTALTEKAIMAFSGGVDSCFTMLRHVRGNYGRWQRNIKAGLMVHGFDISIENNQLFDQTAEKLRIISDSLGIELITMATNFRELKLDWEDVFGTAIASCLMLLQGGYTAGIIAGSAVYSELLLPYGSNPITDRLLSSKSFEIVHDGASFTRLDKISQIANWTEAVRNLKVCWQEIENAYNCGRCEKCIRTILGFRVMGLGLPPCFEEDVNDIQIVALKEIKEDQLTELDPIVEAAKAAKISDSWVKALTKCIQRNRRAAKIYQYKQSLKQLLR